MNKKQEQEMFGCTIEELKGVNLFTQWNDPVDLLTLAKSMLSDAQHVLLRSTDEITPDSEDIRLLINRSKFVISQALTFIREKERNQ